MSLRAGRQADEAISPLSPGRRLLRCARKDIKDGMSLRAGRQADEAISPPAGEEIASLRSQRQTFAGEEIASLRSQRQTFAGAENASLRSQRH